MVIEMPGMAPKNRPISRPGSRYAQAIQEALAQAMDADPSVFLMGEDIGVYGGAFQVTGDLVHRYGEGHVMDAPISELGQEGVDLRPGVEIKLALSAAPGCEELVSGAAEIKVGYLLVDLVDLLQQLLGHCLVHVRHLGQQLTALLRQLLDLAADGWISSGDAQLKLAGFALLHQR